MNIEAVSTLTHFSVYDKASGLFVGRQFSVQVGGQHTLNVREGEAAIEGQHDHLSRRVDLAQDPPVVIDHQPPQPSADHEWHAETRRWRLSSEAQARADARITARARIAHLETAQLRPLRELALDFGNKEARLRLQEIEAEIAALRASL